MAAIAAERGWKLISNAAHPGYTRTNLQTAGAALGRDKLPWWHELLTQHNPLPSQGVEQGTEPLLYAATSPDAASGAYYGPSKAFGLVGPTKLAKAPARALDAQTNSRLWLEAERLTGISLTVRS